jgi:ferredoxin
MSERTGLPEVDESKCTSCGLCVKTCPKGLFEIRKKGPESKRIYVACMNKDKGAVAKRACSVACIGCGKCEKVCEFEAITIKNNLSYINFRACTLCRKCVETCPTGSIHEINF